MRGNQFEKEREKEIERGERQFGRRRRSGCGWPSEQGHEVVG